VGQSSRAGWNTSKADRHKHSNILTMVSYFKRQSGHEGNSQASVTALHLTLWFGGVCILNHVLALGAAIPLYSKVINNVSRKC
jgi:hypothetical protein